MKAWRKVCNIASVIRHSASIIEAPERSGLIVDDTVKSGDDPQVRGDAFKTLFVARLSYDTTEKDLEREFGRFGPIERACLTLPWAPALYANICM